MTWGEVAYLSGVIAAFAAFSAGLVYSHIKSGGPKRQAQAPAGAASRHPLGSGKGQPKG